MTADLQSRALEAWQQLHAYAVNFDFQQGVQPLSSWQAPAVRAHAFRADSSLLSTIGCCPRLRRAADPMCRMRVGGRCVLAVRGGHAPC